MYTDFCKYLQMFSPLSITLCRLMHLQTFSCLHSLLQGTSYVKLEMQLLFTSSSQLLHRWTIHVLSHVLVLWFPFVVNVQFFVTGLMNCLVLHIENSISLLFCWIRFSYMKLLLLRSFAQMPVHMPQAHILWLIDVWPECLALYPENHTQ